MIADLTPIRSGIGHSLFIRAHPRNRGYFAFSRPNDPIIYSVGENFKDDGGSETPTSPRGKQNQWERQDVVLHLKRPIRELPADSNYDDITVPPPGTTLPSK